MLCNSGRSEDDQRIVVSLKQGNQQSFAMLYDKYAPALLGIISRIVNTKELAEEILSISFVKAWNEVASFNPDRSSLFTWLLNLARQTALAKMKTGDAKNSLKDNPVYGETETGSAGAGIGQKSAFDLVYFKGLTFIDAAAELHISVDEVKADLRSTIQRLKEKEVIC